jgi:primosomal protein N' (replication factor Y) (superfamily II helicase)
MKYADIYVNLPVDGPFTYSIPEGMTPAAGCRVRVPFGARKVVGYVERVHATPPEGFIAKDLLEVIDQ